MNPRTPPGRRGMLLLMVLSLLTLFLLMGTTFLVLATRARTTARAFMTATSDIQSSPSVPRQVLDEALLMLLRGCQPDDNPAVGPGEISGESLLGDMYGADGERTPFCNAATNEWDSFDSDLFLTQTSPGGGILRPSYATPGAAAEVDNDADGVPDGVWLPNLFPRLASSSGGSLTFRVSFLVLDLDSRINVNAHGGGSGNLRDGRNPFGPADIDGSALTPFTDGVWLKVLSGGSATGGAPTVPPQPSLSPTQEIAGRGGSAYTVRLDRSTSRPAILPRGVAPSPPNPYTYGELERVLRPFDPDWSTLPPRLSAFLSDLPGTARWLVTTDSWDVGCWVGLPARGSAPRQRFNIPKAIRELTNAAGVLDRTAFANRLYNAIQDLPGSSADKAQWAANVAEFAATVSPTPPAAPAPVSIGTHTVTGANPSGLGLPAGSWTGLVSSADLLLIPRGSAGAISPILSGSDPLPPGLGTVVHSLVTTVPEILEAVTFSQYVATVDADAAAGRFREPGKINVNTCSPPVLAAIGVPPPLPGNPHRSMWTLLRTVVAPGWLPNQLMNPPGVEPLFQFNTVAANRALLNRVSALATVRSNVFAVWITVEAADSAPDAGPPTRHRLFAIIDRSIPVRYQRGQNNDVRQVICLKRFLN